MTRNIILVDIDHVISDAFWRDDLIKRSRDNNDWEEYHSRGKEDKPLEDMVTLVNHIARYNTNIEVWAISARPDKWRKQTLDWFLKHDIMLDVILMRPEEAFKPAPQIKMDLCINEGILDRVLCIFDDREDVIQAFREAGVTAFQVYSRRNV